MYEVVLASRKDDQCDWVVISEKIFSKAVNNQTAKKNLFNFEGLTPDIDRLKFDSQLASVLADDDSIFRMLIAKEKYQPQAIIDTLTFTNNNPLYALLAEGRLAN